MRAIVGGGGIVWGHPGAFMGAQMVCVWAVGNRPALTGLLRDPWRVYAKSDDSLNI